MPRLWVERPGGGEHTEAGARRIAGWRDEATHLNIPKAEQDLMVDAFQTTD